MIPVSSPKPIDVVVVGAGSAGAALAWKLAAEEISVLLIDRAPREKLGRPWINGVEERLFPAIGLGQVKGPIRFADRSRFIIESPAGYRITIERPRVAEIDMRELSSALRRNALLLGARTRFDTDVRRLIVEGGLVRGVVARNREGDEEQIRARCVVHAAGHRPLPGTEALGEEAPGGEIDDADLCIASQEVYEIEDPAAAERFMAERGLRPHDALSRIGVRGGYAISNTSIDLDRRHASFLSGAMLHEGGGASRDLIDEYRRDLGFTGKRLFGGSGLIPVRRPHDRLVGPGYALLGDAAAQVYPAHGSGVAAGIRAALLLANTLSGALRSVAELDSEALWPYAALFMRSRGALCAGAEIVRKLAEGFTAEELDRLVGGGLMRADISHEVIACRPARVPIARLPGLFMKIAMAGALGRKVAAATLRSKCQERHYRRYPAQYDPRGLREWAGMAAMRSSAATRISA
ncbi:MAG: hypothetical protein CME06_05765 [Gemmatimonadetes bacterium]|nr:hypothetical protein [Gemmatimonadota bacterium]